MKHRSRHAWSVSGALLTGALLLGGGVAGAQSPGRPAVAPAPRRRAHRCRRSPPHGLLGRIPHHAGTHHRLRRRVAQQAVHGHGPGMGRAACRIDADVLVRCVERIADPDRAGRTGGRLRVRGPQEPPDAHRRVPGAGAHHRSSPATTWSSSCRRRTRPASHRPRTSRSRACASLPPVMTCPSPGTRSRSSPTSRPLPVPSLATPMPSTPTSCPGRTTSRRSCPRSSWARVTQASSMPRMRRPRPASPPSPSPTTPTCSPGTARWRSRARPQPTTSAAFLGYLLGPEAQAILAQFGFLPPQ